MWAQWVCSRERRIALYKRSSVNQSVHTAQNGRQMPRRPGMDEDISMEQKTWQVYSLGKINVFRLDLNESREGFCWRERGTLEHTSTYHDLIFAQMILKWKQIREGAVCVAVFAKQMGKWKEREKKRRFLPKHFCVDMRIFDIIMIYGW